MPKLEDTEMQSLEKRVNDLEAKIGNPLIMGSLLPDWRIRALATKRGMITPFVEHQVKEQHGKKLLSYGLSSYGYDLRLSPSDFRVFKHLPGKVLDPKNFDSNFLEIATLEEDESGKYFILPGNSYGLGVTIEYLKIPPNVSCIFLGKSSYARSGLIANMTLGEPEWEGNLTLEFSNSSSADARIYAEEGVIQALFFQSEGCEVTYAKRSGKYQKQGSKVTVPKV